MFRMTALASVIAIAALFAPADGTASGTLTVKGAATKMAFAYARFVPNPMDKGKQAIRLVLSDVAIEPKLLAESMPFGLQDLTRAGKLHGISALIGVDDHAVLSTSMYDAGFKMSSVSVAGTNIKLDIKTLDKTTIAGKLYTVKSDDFNDVVFEYAITFSAPIAAQSSRSSN